MAEQEKQDINIPIEAKIKATKGLKLGDDRFNPLEKKLLDDIIVEHGEAIASTREAMNADFSNLLEDVADLSEGNQRQLREVAEMLGVTLKTKDGGLQMNYELFQKILSFQRDNKMKLTGVVDDILYQALKKHSEEKKTTPPEVPENTDNTTQPTPETEQIPPRTIPSSIPRATPINSEQENTVEQYEGQDQRISMPTLPNSPIQSAPETTAPTSPVKPTSTPSGTAETKSEVRALPVEEATKKTAEVEAILTEEAKKLGITIDDINLAQSPFGQSIVDMILYYEGPGGRRQKDVGNTYEIGGGVNTGSSEQEKRYALGENYEAWNSSFIPKEHVRECVQKLLHSRIAVTRKSCSEKGVDFDSLPQNVKAVMIDLHYNMPHNINKFTKFWTAIKEKNWQEAGLQLVDNGLGGPSGYVIGTGGRSYANALGIATGDISSYKKNKQEVEKMSSEALLDRYIQEVGEYGKKVGIGERKDIVKNAQNEDELLSETTSADVLRTKGSTKSITKMLDTYIKGEGLTPEQQYQRKQNIIQSLKNQIGNFSRPLQTIQEIGAFQQLIYLVNPIAFEKLKFIDGVKGPKTTEAFDNMKDRELHDNA